MNVRTITNLTIQSEINDYKQIDFFLKLCQLNKETAMYDNVQ